MVIWSNKANKDLKNIYEFIAIDSKYYANKVFREIILKVSGLNDFPQIGKVILEIDNKNLRELLLYSYRLIYRIDKNSNILIITIVHQRKIFNRENYK